MLYDLPDLSNSCYVNKQIHFSHENKMDDGGD